VWSAARGGSRRADRHRPWSFGLGSWSVLGAWSSAALRAYLAAAVATDLVDLAPVALVPQIGGTDVGATTLFPLGASSTVVFRFRDASGNIGLASSTVTVGRSPDVNHDGIVDTRDLATASRSVGKLIPR
jgi:hypothetical protein